LIVKQFLESNYFRNWKNILEQNKIKDELHKHLKKLLESAINEVSKTN